MEIAYSHCNYKKIWYTLFKIITTGVCLLKLQPKNCGILMRHSILSFTWYIMCRKLIRRLPMYTEYSPYNTNIFLALPTCYCHINMPYVIVISYKNSVYTLSHHILNTQLYMRQVRCWHGYLSAARCRWFAYGPADATAIHRLLLH